MKTMKAVSIYSYGGPEVLVQKDAPRPHIDVNEVLVQVHAAAINPVDWKVREGQLKASLPHTFPLVLGWDVSGVVAQIGSGVGRLKVGDEVFSRPDILRDGAYAEFVAIRESEVVLKPRSVDHVHAAALPLAGLTAWQALFDVAGLVSGQRILIHGAAGGVGHLAVQLARNRGAQVIGTASATNHDFLRKLGIDEVIDYWTVRFEDVVRDVDVVLDTIGGAVQERSMKVLKPGGILVSTVSAPSVGSADEHRVRHALVVMQPNAIQLTEIARMVDAGKLGVCVETILPLSDAAGAQELNRRGHTRGKIVLQVVEQSDR